MVTGFQSLKALSPEACKPFDASRVGLNLGEAAAAIVLKADEGDWELVAGAIRNDANHISGPSRTGEGSYNALRAVLPFVEKKDLAFVNVHGTATVYNDEMESIALGRAGLTDVPVNALKGYFGHTMGAAGLLESILSMKALEAGIVPATRGFSQLGVSVPVRVSDKEQSAIGNSFIKLLSGFGGVNRQAFPVRPLSPSCTGRKWGITPSFSRWMSFPAWAFSLRSASSGPMRIVFSPGKTAPCWFSAGRGALPTTAIMQSR